MTSRGERYRWKASAHRVRLRHRPDRRDEFHYVDLTYGTTVNIDASLATGFRLVVTNGTAFTIAAPTNADQLRDLELLIVASSGGALGAITWNAAFKQPFPWTNPANGKGRVVRFRRFAGEYCMRAGRRPTSDDRLWPS
jgi:hypothetical protein